MASAGILTELVVAVWATLAINASPFMCFDDVYRVALDVQDMPQDLQQLAWRGHLVLHADWESPASRYLRQALAVLVREAGF